MGYVHVDPKIKAAADLLSALCLIRTKRRSQTEARMTIPLPKMAVVDGQCLRGTCHEVQPMVCDTS